MKTALRVKIARSQRVRSASGAGYSMEFSDLLDGIEPEPVVAVAKPATAELDLGLADLVMFPVPQRFTTQPELVIEPVELPEAVVADVMDEPVEEPPKVSRFAANGLDDDLLPVHTPRRRFRR